MIWPHVTKKNPCPVCAKPDWCSIGDRAVLCQRVESKHPARKGGWYHPLDSNCRLTTVERKPKPAPPVLTGIAKIIENWASHTDIEAFEQEAASLGVSPESLASLNMVYSQAHRAWAFPMRDGYGEMIGIRLRASDGRKWAVRGSRGGIFLPVDVEPQPIAYLVEGPTSTAAALTLGLFAIGRPQNNAGGDLILTALKRLKIFRVVIIADNDDKLDGLRPGFDGAKKLQSELRGIKSVIWTSPTKDVRDFLKAGGSRQLIESEIKNLIWVTG